MKEQKDTLHKLDPSHVESKGWSANQINLKYVRLDERAVRRMKHIPFMNDWNTVDEKIFQEKGEEHEEN